MNIQSACRSSLLMLKWFQLLTTLSMLFFAAATSNHQIKELILSD